MARKFKLIDSTGSQSDATTMLQKPWFMKFLSLALDAEYYGHSLIEFGNIVKHTDGFDERFGIPLIYAELATHNPADRTKVEDMMANMGNQSWAVFSAGVKLQLLETTKGDSFKVFDDRINRANKEISIGLAGQTMAFEDGASRSQSEVHERGFEEIMWAMAVNLRFLINTKLLPLMAMHGFAVQRLSFDWDDSYDFTATEMKEIEQMLLANYEIDPQYFAEKYNIPITGRRAIAGGMSMAAGNPREMVQLLREWNPDFFV